MRRQLPHFAGVVADIDHGYAGFVAQPHQIGQDFHLALFVQRSQRLVQQQQPRLRQQRASERDALALAARELTGTAIKQAADVEQIGDARTLRGVVGKPVHAPPVVEVLAHIEMRKQPGILEHIADAAAVRRDMQVCRRVVQHFAVDGDDAAIGPQQSRDDVDQRGLAGARGAEQPGDPAFAGKRGFDREFAELSCNVDAQHAQFPCRRRRARRANHSEATSAASAMTTETSTSRSAALSPSGVWISE